MAFGMIIEFPIYVWPLALRIIEIAPAGEITLRVERESHGIVGDGMPKYRSTKSVDMLALLIGLTMQLVHTKTQHAVYSVHSSGREANENLQRHPAQRGLVPVAPRHPDSEPFRYDNDGGYDEAVQLASEVDRRTLGRIAFADGA